MATPTFAVALQARLGSSRLPGKVLRDLYGKPMFQQIYEQTKGSKYIQHWTLTTSDVDQDMPLVEFAQSLGMKAYCGNVDDIVSRLYGALNLTPADYLVRIWGDCPFVCPDVIDAMIEEVLKNNLDYIYNGDVKTRTFPPGLDLEIYSKKLLARMNQEVTDPKLREFPMEYMRAHWDEFGTALYNLPENFSHIHLTVDYPEDLAAAEKMYQVLKKGKSFFTLKDLYPLFSNHEMVGAFSHQARNIEYHQYLSGKGQQA